MRIFRFLFCAVVLLGQGCLFVPDGKLDGEKGVISFTMTYSNCLACEARTLVPGEIVAVKFELAGEKGDLLVELSKFNTARVEDLSVSYACKIVVEDEKKAREKYGSKLRKVENIGGQMLGDMVTKDKAELKDCHSELKTAYHFDIVALQGGTVSLEVKDGTRNVLDRLKIEVTEKVRYILVLGDKSVFLGEQQEGLLELQQGKKEKVYVAFHDKNEEVPQTFNSICHLSLSEAGVAQIHERTSSKKGVSLDLKTILRKDFIGATSPRLEGKEAGSIALTVTCPGFQSSVKLVVK